MKMTTKQKQEILQMAKEGKSVREIAALLNIPKSTVNYLSSQKDKIKNIIECPICGKEIINYIGGGRYKEYCSRKCYDSKQRRKNVERICQCCGKPFKAWYFAKTRYCSNECFLKDTYGKKITKPE